MKVLIIVESYFGNTMAVAEAIAAGVQAAGGQIVGAESANVLDDCDLVIVGAPTHNLGLPTLDSRLEAAKRGGADLASGVAEWLDGLPETVRAKVASFDTVTSKGDEAGSAAKKIEERLSAAGAPIVGRESFLVAGEPPELNHGELARAKEWGAKIVAQAS